MSGMCIYAATTPRLSTLPPRRVGTPPYSAVGDRIPTEEGRRSIQTGVTNAFRNIDDIEAPFPARPAHRQTVSY